jgi:addiction module RelB/DinJ family antitoxin
MNTAIINIKTESEVKFQAQEVARQFGISLSGLINAYLKQLIRTKKVEFTLEEIPNENLVQVLKQAKIEIKKGNVSPKFTTSGDAKKWLNG